MTARPCGYYRSPPTEAPCGDCPACRPSAWCARGRHPLPGRVVRGLWAEPEDVTDDEPECDACEREDDAAISAEEDRRAGRE